MSWLDVDLTVRADAPPASGLVMGYVTNLAGQGPVARVLYGNEDDNHAHELSTADGKQWSHADLTDLAHAPEVFLRPMGYVTSLAGQGPVARVVYLGMADEYVHELSTSDGSHWSHANLTDLARAPATTSLVEGYTTSFAGQGPVARVVYQGRDDQHVHELSSSDGSQWSHTDLTDLTNAPPALGVSGGFITSLAGQEPVARLVYKGRPDGHIQELSTFGGGHWSHADLTAIAGGPVADDVPMGYATRLAGQGPVVRVIYLASDPFSQREQRVHELSTSDGRDWSFADLTDSANAPLATSGPPQGYTTSLAGQSAMARVVYLGGHGRRIHELSTPDGGHWSHADLTDLADGPPADSWPMAYTTSLAGQGPVARVLYRATDNHIHEFSTSS
jgi:Fungal fucose-specific lectin